jgi:hypothetical protein
MLSSRAAIDAVAHEIVVGLLDDVAEMDADAEFDAAVGRQASVALDHAVLHFDRAPHGVDHAAELRDEPVAGSLDDAAAMHGDGRVDQVAPQRAEPRERAILIGAREPAVADHIRDQDCSNLPGLAHSSGNPALRRPSTSGGMFAPVLVCNHLRVSSGLRRRASAKAGVASSFLPSSA